MCMVIFTLLMTNVFYASYIYIYIYITFETHKFSYELFNKIEFTEKFIEIFDAVEIALITLKYYTVKFSIFVVI